MQLAGIYEQLLINAPTLVEMLHGMDPEMGGSRNPLNLQPETAAPRMISSKQNCCGSEKGYWRGKQTLPKGPADDCSLACGALELSCRVLTYEEKGSDDMGSEKI